MRTSSVTSLKTYLTCPKRYYFAYVEWLPKEDERPSVRLSVSRILHTALSTYHAAGEKEWGNLDRALAETWDPRLFPNGCDSADEYHRSRWMLWNAWESISTGETVLYGHNADAEFGGGKFRCRIDRIDQEPDGITFVEYHVGDTVYDMDKWTFQVYGSVSAKLMRQPLRAIRVIRLGSSDPEMRIDPDDPIRVEQDIKRLRRTIESDKYYNPRPDHHCRYCPYLNICDAADKVEGLRRTARPNEIFRLFRSIEVLIESGETFESLKLAAEQAIRQIHEQAKLVWIDGHLVSGELLRLFTERIETEGEIVSDGTNLSVAPGSSLLVPILDAGVAVFPKEVSRTTAEIYGRSLRVVWERLANFIHATTDGLTGLGRRESFQNRVSRFGGGDYSIIICDIDHFKKINDTYGHDAGDIGLKTVAKLLKEEAGGTAYRLGGEEFIMLVPSCDRSFCLTTAESLRSKIEAAEFVYNGTRIPITMSFGVASNRTNESHSDTLKRADGALYKAKTGGRNRVEIDE